MPPAAIEGRRAAARAFWLGVGISALGLGLLGIALPLLPTTVFLLIAAFAFSRSSPRLHAWLLSHPRLGRPILDWYQHGCISVTAKCMAVLAMLLSIATAWLAGAGTTVLAVQAVTLLCVAAFVLSRPGRPAAGPRAPH